MNCFIPLTFCYHPRTQGEAPSLSNPEFNAVEASPSRLREEEKSVKEKEESGELESSMPTE